eukprot:284907_1
MSFLTKWNSNNLIVNGIRMSANHHYKVLGVDKTATEKEIKRAYRKLAKECIPNKHTNQTHQLQEKLKQIAQAYETLSNTENREEYDQDGTTSLFSSFEKEVNIKITLEEACNGIQNRKIILFKKKLYENDFIVQNDHLICYGFSRNCVNTKKNFHHDLFIPTDIINEIYKYLHYYTCSKCKGTGHVTVSKQISEYMMVQRDEECKLCDGANVRNINVTKTIDIPIGMNELYVLVENEQCIPIPYVIYIEWETHKVYDIGIDGLRVDGKKENLFMTCDISLKQALLGFNSNLIKINHLNGKLLTLNIKSECDKVIQPESYYVIKGCGMPYYINHNDDRKYGDLKIKFNVILPENKSDVLQFCNGFNLKERGVADCVVFVEPY